MVGGGGEKWGWSAWGAWGGVECGGVGQRGVGDCGGDGGGLWEVWGGGGWEVWGGGDGQGRARGWCRGDNGKRENRMGLGERGAMGGGVEGGQWEVMPWWGGAA